MSSLLSQTRAFLRYLLALSFFVVGVFHLESPELFLVITPGWVPYPKHVIFLTGLCEIAGAIGLLTSRWRQAAGLGLGLYTLCVWPANIHHAMNNIVVGEAELSWWYHGPRLAFQPVIIWWALWAGGVVQWPCRKRTD